MRCMASALRAAHGSESATSILTRWETQRSLGNSIATSTWSRLPRPIASREKLATRARCSGSGMTGRTRIHMGSELTGQVASRWRSEVFPGCGSTLAQRWQKLGWQIVLREAERQVQPDGMHFEQSTYYHTYALDFLLHSRILADLNGMAVPATLDRIMEKMLDVLCTLGRAGSVPQFGDDDGGRVFDPRRNRAGELLDPLATGAVLFNRADFKAVAGSIREETVWLLGAAGT